MMIHATNTVTFETFRCGVQACRLEAKRGESVWLEVIGPYGRTPEMYPGGPRGNLTGSFSSRIHGAIFKPKAILKGWDALGVESFWHSLMGIDRTPYISSGKLIRDAESLSEYPDTKLDRSSRLWLMTAGCIDQDKINGRWNIIREIFDHTTDLDVDERRSLNIFLEAPKKIDARKRFCVDGSTPECFEYIFKKLRRRAWLLPVAKNTAYKVSTTGLQVLDVGHWIKKTKRLFNEGV